MVPTKNELPLDPYHGSVAPAYNEPTFLAELRELPRHLAEKVSRGPLRRSQVRRADLHRNGERVPVAVKVFRPQGAIRSLLAKTYGSKARQSWDIASALTDRGVATPRPIAYLERWDSGRLCESYFLTEFEDEISSFHRELLQLFHKEPQIDKFLNLMDCVAEAVRAMHDRGVQHGDMGNQNIVVRRKGPYAWGDVQFIDVNRGCVRDDLTMRERAFDISRLTLPGRLRKIFLRMYFRDRFLAGERRPPKDFDRWERHYRRRFALHSLTRPLRRPLRWLRRRKYEAQKVRYPSPRDMWLWDERSDQAVGALMRRESYWLHSRLSSLRQIWEGLVAVVPTWIGFRKLRPAAYRQPVAMKGRIGMTVTLRPDTAEREVRLLEGLGRLPLLARYYHHEPRAQWDFTSQRLRELHTAGHPVSIALVQNRRSVVEPDSWRDFVHYVFDQVGDIVEDVEVGHATNRVKWGVWRLYNYRDLLRPMAELQERFPRVKFMGPAINDFEFHYVVGSLAVVPYPLQLGALSLHLYVDRRGPPENEQHRFSSVDKFVLARVLARRAPRCDDRVVVSEVNWFLKDTGGGAHEFAPYAGSNHDWDVTEDTYADYMLRYYLHALCSGMIDRVYWWRLAAQLFGLVDDSGAEWRPRVAYHVLARFVELFGEATFVEKLNSPEHVHLLRFRRPDGTDAVVGFASDGEIGVSLPFDYERAVDSTGELLAASGPKVTLTGRPSYFLSAGFAGAAHS